MKAMSAFVFVVAMMAQAHAASHGIFPTRNEARHGLRSGSVRQGKVLYFGGPVISNVKVYAVFWGKNVNGETRAKIGNFFSAVTNSSYFDWLNEYDTNTTAVDGRPGTNQVIGRGTFVGSISITPANTQTSLNDSDVQAELLDAQIFSGALPRPDDNTVYFVFFPPGVQIAIDGSVSCQEFCAYHEGFVSKNFGNVFYGVMPDLGGACAGGCGYATTPFSSLTEITSHELMEAVTDPFPTPGSNPAFPQAWNTSDGEEIGDLCAGESTSLSASSATYTLQQEWQNSINGCARGPYQAP